MSKYPRISQTGTRRLNPYSLRKDKVCIVCGIAAKYALSIEYSYFNDEEDVAFVCKEHIKPEYHNKIMELQEAE